MYLPGVKRFSHWSNPFLPDLIVENEIAEPGMFLELEAEQVFRFALIPIGGVDLRANTRGRFGFQGCEAVFCRTIKIAPAHILASRER
jgi:hypothetical protein